MNKRHHIAIYIAIFVFSAFQLLNFESASTQSIPGLTETTITSGSTAYNAVVYVPPNTTGNLPAVVFIPGLGERGIGSGNIAELYNNGPLGFIKNNGWTPDFVVIGIQPNDGWASETWVHNMLTSILANSSFRVDPNKLYLTGLSAGAFNIFDYIRYHASPVAISAIIPMSYTWNAGENDSRYANIRVWGLSGSSDSHYVKMKAFVDSLTASGYDAKFTSYSGGHCCWSTYYNPSWTENGKSIYDWALNTSGGGGGASNQPPNANAGTDQTITLPTNSVTLSGSGTDSDGSISSYSWTKFSGGSATITSPSSASTTVTGLAQGSYTFQLQVTDNGGATSSDVIDITVNPAPLGNQSPTANAGTDQTTSGSSVTLSGSGTDSDGSISSYAWTTISGTGATITSPSSASTTVTGLTQGSYTFQLQVTDNSGATATDTMAVTVSTSSGNVSYGTTAPSTNDSNDHYLIDFGSTTYRTNTTGWNNITASSLGTTASLVKTTGASSSASIAITDAFLTGNNTLGTTSSSVYPSTAVQDSIYVGTLGGTTDNQGVIRISGLSNNLHTFTFYASRVASDSTNRTAQYSIGNVAGSINATNNVDNIVTISGVQPAGGIVDITVTSIGTLGYLGVIQIDDQGGSSTPPPTGNQSPTVNAGTDQTITLPTNSVTLSGSGTDSDGSISSYAWTTISGTGATITTPSSSSTTVTGLAQGSYTFQLQVTDNGGATATDTIDVVVNAQGQTQQPSSQTTSSGTTSPSTADSYDHYLVDFGSTSYPTSTNGWNNITSAAAGTSLALVKSTGTSSSVTLSITDAFNSVNTSGTTSSSNYTSSATRDSLFLGNLSGVNDNQGIIRISGLSNTLHTFTFFASRVSGDGGNRTAQYTINGTSVTLNATDNVNNLVSIGNVTPSNGIVDITVTNQGTYSYIGVLQIDSSGTAGGTTNPTPGNVAPTVNAGTDQTITLPTNSVTLSGSGTDSDGSISSYAWTTISGTGATITSPSSASTTVTGLAQGSYTFQLQVTDNSGATATDTMAVTVIPASTTTASYITSAPSITTPYDHFLIDLGSTSYPTNSTGWNNITSAAAGTTANLITTGGLTSSVTLAITDAFNSVNTLGTTSNSSYVSSATRDSIFLGNLSGVNDNQGVIRISGLSNTLHTFTFFASRVANDGGNRTAQYTIGNTSITLNATDNVDNFAQISNILPVNGIVDITVTNAGTYAYLGTLQIDTGNATSTSTSCPAKKIVVLGSSTAFGNAASPSSNSWVNLFASYLGTLNPGNTVVNYGTSGFTTYHVLPTGTSIPTGRPAQDVNKNMTRALAQNPDGIIINMPTNDTANGYPISEQQANFILLANTAISANVPVWITTTQPRNLGTSARTELMTMRDWIQTTFPNRSLDFWTTVANTDGTINATYNSGDGIHLNNAGHAILADRAQNSNIMSVLCGGAGAGTTIPTTPPTTQNASPTVNAGNDQGIYLPTNSVTLSGSAADSDGTIISYSWTKLSGGNADISSSTSSTTLISGLTQGTYTFQLQATDDDGATATDTVTITVSPALISSGRTIMLPVGTTNKQIYSLTAGTTYGILPGDRLVIPKNKEIISLALRNFAGTPEAPVIIEMEDPSTSTIGGYGGYAFNIQNASHFIVRNVVIDGKTTSGYGMAIGNGTSNYTVENVIIRNTGSGQGFIAKWDPVAGDPSTAYPNTINNITLRNMYVENVGTEGYYIGHTATPSSLPPGMLPAPIVNLVAENLTSYNTGWDGIQITDTRNIQARNLKAINFGTTNNRSQQGGIQIGGGTTGTIDGFEATNGSGAGIALFGRGLFTIKNAALTNVATSSTEHGIYVDDYANADLPPLQLNFENISIDGTTVNNPIYVKNTNNTMIPGVLKNIFYRNVGAGKQIFDASNSQIIGGTQSGLPFAVQSSVASTTGVINNPPTNPTPSTNTGGTNTGTSTGTNQQQTSSQNQTQTNTSQTKEETKTQTSTNLGTAVVGASRLNMRSAPITGQIINTLTLNESVTIIGKQGDWYKVVSGDTEGWVSGTYLKNIVNTPSEATSTTIVGAIGTALVNANKLNMRSAPINGQIISSLSRNDSITILAKDGTWYKVIVGDTEGWVSGTYLKNIKNTSTETKSTTVSGKSGQVTATILNLRSAPTTGSVVTKLNRSTKFTVEKQQGNWLQIKTADGLTGWVSAQYVKVDSATTTSTTKSSFAPGSAVMVKSQAINVRKSPRTGEIVKTILMNTKGTVQSSSDAWSYVIFEDGTEGYVADSVLKK